MSPYACNAVCIVTHRWFAAERWAAQDSDATGHVMWSTSRWKIKRKDLQAKNKEGKRLTCLHTLGSYGTGKTTRTSGIRRRTSPALICTCTCPSAARRIGSSPMREIKTTYTQEGLPKTRNWLAVTLVSQVGLVRWSVCGVQTLTKGVAPTVFGVAKRRAS
jgi:hypothetical protein